MNVHPAKARDGSHVKDAAGKLGWRMEYMAGKDPATGKPRRLVERFYGTQKQAKDAWGGRQREIDEQGSGFVKPAKETVAEYLTAWLDTYGAAQLRVAVVEDYRHKIDLYVVPLIGAVPLADLTAHHVDEALGRLIRPKEDCGKGVSRSTARYVHRVLRAALNEAVRKGDLARNPVALVRAPRDDAKKVPSFTRPDMDILTASARKHRLEALFLAAWQTGLRGAELRALRWVDVDLGAGELHVRQDARDLKGGRIVFDKPKSRSSRRTVPTPPPLVEELEAHRGRQADEMRDAGDRWQDNGLVFPTSLGTPLLDRNLKRTWYILRDRKKVSDEKDAAPVLPAYGFHSLRHTFGSLALSASIPLEVVSEWMGHSSVEVTKRIYADVLPALHAAAKQRFAAYIATGKVELPAPVPAAPAV